MAHIIIQKKGISYVCLLVPGKYKCGNCLRGNIAGRIGECCRVCKAVVASTQLFKSKLDAVTVA